MQAEHVISPETYSFNQQYMGKGVNPVKLNKIWRKYTDQVYADQLEQACKATGCIAVHSSLLSRTEKDQNRERRYYSNNRRVYYLFPADSVPLTIYCKLPHQEGRIIYE